jgi:transcriptional regulator GlxA family with amidase domain
MKAMENIASAKFLTDQKIGDFANHIADLLEQVSDAFDKDRKAARHTLAVAYRLVNEEISRQRTDVAPPFRLGGLSGWQAKRLANFIDANLDGPIQISELCDLAHLSTGHFYRAFKQTFKDTPHNYIMNCRIERAKAMMCETADTLASISQACGFADQAHLSKLFRTKFRQSPSVWRRAMSEEMLVPRAAGGH